MIDSFSLENCDINITLLDKIYQHKRVLEQLVKLQLQYFNHGKPIEFLKAPILDVDLLNKTLQRRLSTLHGGGTIIPLVTSQMERIVDKHRRPEIAEKH